MASMETPKTKCARCAIVVLDVFPKIMQELIADSTSPEICFKKVNSAEFFKTNRLNREQWHSFQSLQSLKSFDDLDFTLIYKIVRFANVFIPAPTQCWGKPPLYDDVTVGDDVERMKFARNHLVYQPTSLVSDDYFNDFFTTFVNVGERIDSYLRKQPQSSFRDLILHYQNVILDPDVAEKHVQSCRKVENLEKLLDVATTSSRVLHIFTGNTIKNKMEEFQEGTIVDGTTPAKFIFYDVNDADVEMIRMKVEENDISSENIKLKGIEKGCIIVYVDVMNAFLTDRVLMLNEIGRFIKDIVDIGKIQFSGEEECSVTFTLTEDEMNDCNTNFNKPKFANLGFGTQEPTCTDNKDVDVVLAIGDQEDTWESNGKLETEIPMITDAQSAAISNVYAVNPTSSTIFITWTKPKFEFDNYEIKYRECSAKEKKPFKTIGGTVEEHSHLSNLRSGTKFDIRVFIQKEAVITEYLKVECQTEDSPLTFLTEMANLEKPADENLIPLYKLKPVSTVTVDNVRVHDIISEYRQPEQIYDEKNILLLGSTGSGKTTLIDALINYVAGVSCGEDYRFSMIQLSKEEQEKLKDEDQSQTTETSCYRLPKMKGFNMNCTRLNIIDTPGFDDTKGREFDKKIIDQIKSLFDRIIDSIDAVCIVIPLANRRLTSAQKYVFKSISEIFGKDIAGNVFALITHDDGGVIAAENALLKEQIKVRKYFKFNNSELYRKEQSADLWNKRTKAFDDLFKALDECQKKTLVQSRQVLWTRVHLGIRLQNIKEKIRVQLQLINNIRNDMNIIKGNTTSQNRDKILFECQKSQKVKKSTTDRVITCKSCKETCHKGCRVYFNFMVRMCEVFKENVCSNCTNHCKAGDHSVEYFFYGFETVVVQKGIKDIPQREKTELSASLDELQKLLTDVSDMNDTLNDIAFRKEDRSLSQYIDNIIDEETAEKDTGYIERVNLLRKVEEYHSAKKSLSDLIGKLI